MMPNALANLHTVGIDVGSSAVKAVLIRQKTDGSFEKVATRCERIRRREPKHVIESAFKQVLDEAKLRKDQLAYIATTGEGENVEFGTGHFYGMTTHARGGLFLEPMARSVIDIGALHARAVLMDERAKVLGYRMTSQCASGSGQFLENIARYLGITLEEIGTLSLQADNPEKCSSICAVLAETDVINMVSRKISIQNILKGIHQSMADRYVRLLGSTGARGVSLVTGGLAADVGLFRCLQESIQEQGLTIEIRVHPDSIFAGAYGAAIWGAFRAKKLSEKGIFVGGTRG